MANNTASEARKIISDIRKGVFSPVYLLMGPETATSITACFTATTPT